MEKRKSIIRPDDIRIETEEATEYAIFVPRISADLAAAILSDPPDRTKPAPGCPYYHIETFEDIEAQREKVDNLLKKYEED